MSEYKGSFHKAVHKAENRYDDAVRRRRKYSKKLWKLRIDVYHSYATSTRLFVRGRVLRDKKILLGSSKDSVWDNFKRTLKRMESDEIDDALLEIQFEDQVQQVRTDEEGYFNLEFPFAQPQSFRDPRKTFEVTLLEAPVRYGDRIVQATGEIFLPPTDADFGVISDVDDTIMVTGATNLLKMIWITFSGNARTRIAFNKVGQWYHALKNGPSGHNHNPFFYVSSSPWNLFDLICNFMAYNQIPIGPLTLRDFGTDENKMGKTSHGAHKKGEIERLFRIYPELNFILIGDSGQYDAFIYYEIAQAHPGRVLAIFIRDAKGSRDEEIHKTIEQANMQGIKMVLFPDSTSAAKQSVIWEFLDKSAIEDF